MNGSAERLGLRSECGYTKYKVQFIKLVQFITVIPSREMYFHFFDLPEYYLQNLAYLIKQ